MGYNLGVGRESDMTEHTHTHTHTRYIMGYLRK